MDLQLTGSGTLCRLWRVLHHPRHLNQLTLGKQANKSLLKIIKTKKEKAKEHRRTYACSPWIQGGTEYARSF
jgi:hypothetical protein